MSTFFVSINYISGASDYDTIKYVADKIDANYGGIYSWTGSAVIRLTVQQTEPPPDFPHKQYMKYVYQYAFDKVKNDFISSASLQDEYSVYGRTEKHLLVANESFLFKDGVFYRFEWFSNRDVITVSVKNNTFFPISSNEISRIIHIHKVPVDMTKQPYRNFLFNPFEKYSSDRLLVDSQNKNSAVMEIRAILKGMNINNIDNLAVSLRSPNSHSKDIATLVTKDDKIILDLRHTNPLTKDTAHTTYIFDVKQGYNVVAHSYQIEKENKVVQKNQWKCNYMQLSNFWLPKITEIDTYLPNITTKQIIDWTSHQINKPIPDSTFTLQNMGVCRGDQLYDERTETNTIITGDDFPPVFHVIETNVRFPFARYVLIVSGIILIVISLFHKYRKWRANRKEEKQ
jgi:hypothetical protein